MPEDRLESKVCDAVDRAMSEASGEVPVSGTDWGLDPALTMTIRAVTELPHPHEPRPEFVARLARQFDLPIATTPNMQAHPVRITPRGRPARSWRESGLVRPVWRVAAVLSLVTLFAVMLGGLWLTIDVGQHRRAGSTTDRTAEIQNESPASAFGAAVILRRILLESGGTFGDSRQGPSFFVVEQGTVSFHTYADQSERVLAPGEIATLSSGSYILLHNTGAEPATVLDIGIYPGGLLSSTSSMSPDVTLEDDPSGPIGVRTADATVTLRVTTLAADEQVAPWATTGQTVLIVESGRLDLTLTGEDVPPPFEPGVVRSRSAGMSVTMLSGVTVDAHNAADQPAELIVLTLSLPTAVSPQS